MPTTEEINRVRAAAGFSPLQAGTNQPAQSLADKYGWNKPAGGAQSTQPPYQPTQPTQPEQTPAPDAGEQDQGPTLSEQLGGRLSDIGATIKSEIPAAVQQKFFGSSEKQGIQFPTEEKIMGHLIGAAGDIGGRVINAILPKGVKDDIAALSKDPNITQVTQHPAVQRALDAYSTFKQNNPAAERDLRSIFNITSAAAGGEAAPGVAKPLEAAGEKVAEKVAETGGALAEKAAPAFKAPVVTPEELVGKVTQAGTEEIPKAKAGLAGIDTKGVKTYADLSSKADEAVKANTAKVDAEFAKDTVPRKVQTLATPVKVGDTTIHHNYVLDAVDQLKDFYSKTNDVPNLKRIEDIETKLNPTKGTGLTPGEVNELAREHGRVLNAYNSEGKLASGLTKQAAENTRAGLKETARAFLKDDAARALDKQTTNMIRVRDLAKEMEDKVQKLKNKFQEAGRLQKAAGYAGKTADVATGGVLRGLFKGITGIGATEGRTLNAIELEKMLEKNLTKLNEISGSK